MEYKFLINNALIENKNLTDKYKTMLSTTLTSLFYFIYNNYGIEVNFDIFLDIIKNMKVVEIEEDIEDIIEYDKKKNILNIKSSTGNANIIFDYYKCLLEIVSQRYDQEVETYQSGLIHVSTDGKEYGRGLNDILISRISTLITDIEDPNMTKLYYDDPTGITLKDVVMKDMIDIIGFENLLFNFFDARGNEMYCAVSKMLGSTEDAKEFYSSIDNYDENRIENRKKYNKYILIMKENKLNNTPIL